MTIATSIQDALTHPFGTQFAPQMAIARFCDGAWEPFEVLPYGDIRLPPSAHVFHYASTCFEGLKAHRHGDGNVHIFRLERHMKRFAHSAAMLYLPYPGVETMVEVVRDLIARQRDWVPDQPGALYIRPTLIGTEHSIGAAARPSNEALLFVLLSPVGDYFETGLKPLHILLDDQAMRTSPAFGQAKTGGNYASALGHIMRAREIYQTQQVLFAPGGDVQETGAANFLLLNDREILTKRLDASFLHGVTRDAILQLGRDFGYRVTERDFTTAELLDWIKDGEAALSGTAAVLAGVGSFVYRGETVTVGDGEIGPNTLKLRRALVDIHAGRVEDPHGWLYRV